MLVKIRDDGNDDDDRSHSACDEAPLSLPLWRGTFIAFSKYCEPEISCHLRGQDTSPGLAISAAGAPT